MTDNAQIYTFFAFAAFFGVAQYHGWLPDWLLATLAGN